MNRVCVIDMPGLSRSLLPAVPPESVLGQWLAARPMRGLTPSFPALTCSVQATLTTGRSPSEHGIIANGLPTFRFADDQTRVDPANFTEYRRRISFWEQSNQFLDVPRFWQDNDGHSLWRTALICFQHSMPGFVPPLRPAADIVLTPKPDHGPDGKFVSLCWSEPGNLVGRLFEKLGPFPLMNYWGPMAGIASSRWIAAAGAYVWHELQPQLQWVYVPHLDYDLQRFGPASPQARQAVADAAAAVEPLLQAVAADGGRVVLLSEYAMRSVGRSVQPNCLLAEAGLLVTRDSADGRIVDLERSPAFAMVDHQIAHIYAKDAAAASAAEKALRVSGVASTALPASRHRRFGDFLLWAEPDVWFDYRWWSNPADAPDFARTVDIHRKPGYDPLELFWDRETGGITQNAALIRGSHGLILPGEAVWITDADESEPATNEPINAADVASRISRMLG